METQTYKRLGLACYLAGNVAGGTAIGAWLAGRLGGNRQMTQDGLFLGVVSGMLYAVGNRLAIAALDHAEHRRWTTGEEEADESGAAPAGRGGLKPASSCGGVELARAPGIEAEREPVQSPGPLSHVKSAANRGGRF